MKTKEVLKKKRQRRLAVVAALLFALAIFLFAVSQSTDLYGFAKGGKNSKLMRRIEERKQDAKDRLRSIRQSLQKAAKQKKAAHQGCNGKNMACPSGQYCYITDTIGLPEGVCIRPGESAP